eukprot:1004225_1
MSDYHEAKAQGQICQIWSLGQNKYGQQLNGSTNDVMELLQIRDVKQKEVDTIHTINNGATFIRYEDGDVDVGGSNSYGKLGIGSDDRKIIRMHPLGFKVNLISTSIYGRHVFVTTQEGGKGESLQAAGWNKYGQLGIKTESDRQTLFTTGPNIPVDLECIAAGYTYTVFVGSDGIMYACGKNYYGALGLGDNTTHVSIPTIIPTKVRMAQVVAGDAHCAGISQNGVAFAWGRNYYGQCGHGKNTMKIHTPTAIDALKEEEMVSVSCGVSHTTFVSSCGTVMTTGYNNHGECGDGSTTHVYTPKPIVVGLEDETVDSVRCGAYHTVATVDSAPKKVYLWGWNNYSQCLVDPSKDKVLIPTQYVLPEEWNVEHKVVQVIPGHYETKIVIFDTAAALMQRKHPKEWTDEEVAIWLGSIENGQYARYKDNFIENEVSGGELEYLTEDMRHRIGIANAIRHLLNPCDKRHDDDDAKDNDTPDLADSFGVTIVQNALGVALTMGEYDEPNENIPDVKLDVDCYEKVLAKQYGYTLMCSKDMKGNPGYRMNKKDVEDYVKKECLPALTGGSFEKVNYDALFVAISGHGTVDGVICSDGKVLRYSQIRKWFAQTDALVEIPRFFCIDACRVIESDDQNNLVRRAPVNASGTNATTITGTTEGNTVRGGKVAKYLCDQLAFNFEENQFEGKWKTFGSLYDAAYHRIKADTKNDDPPQQLTMTEYDRPVDKVVFVPRSRTRGGPTKRHAVDTRQMSIAPDFLRKFLLEIKMEHHYEVFKKHKFHNKEKLLCVNENILDLWQIRSQSDRAAILKA